MWNRIRLISLFKELSVGRLSNCLVFILFAINYPHLSHCQTSFNMTYKEGNYFITSSMNNHDNVEIFVESGLPGILINEHNYNRLFVDSLYQTVDSSYSEIKSFYGSHSVSKIKYGKVYIGDLSYQGNVYVIDRYNKIGIPIHMLKNEQDSTANMIRFNFNRRILDFVGKDSIVKKNEYKVVELSPMPVVETTLFLADTYGHSGNIKGKFIFDIGNSSPLYLFNRNLSLQSFIKRNGFKIFPAKDKSDNNVGNGIYADYCRVGRQKIRNASIGLTDRIYISDILGCIGPSLFMKGYVIIDTKNNVIYYE